jgi:hypothetical protein
MTRLLGAFFGLAGAVALVAAAPVPTHLMPKDPPLYHPVQKGTRWVYEGGLHEGTFVISAAEKDEKDKTTVVTIAQVQPGGKEEPYQKLAVSRRGVLWLANPSPLDTPVWLIKNPVKAGEAWDFQTSGPAVVEGKGTRRVVGVETVEVPAGKFTAVRVEEDFTGIFNGKPIDRFRQTVWFAPGVGIVQSDFEGIKTVLKSFTPGKD